MIITKSSFLYNWGGEGGLSIWSTTENVLDGGGNCHKSKNDWGCQGINFLQQCYTFIGSNTMCVEATSV